MSSSITPDLLKRIIADQLEEHTIPADYIPRVYEQKLLQLRNNKEIIVLTGVRRSGKSVLMHYVRQNSHEADYYLNFEDERLATFTINDFQLLQEVFIELFGVQQAFYFDEIQNIPGWEMFIRRLYNAGNKIYITGSNANLFSEELGTRLTGRYIPITIYPLSFYEYIFAKEQQLLKLKVMSTTQIGKIKAHFREYYTVGGIPEYTKHHNIDYLHALYNSILYRDIIARYKISLITEFKQLVFFLASNCSKEITYNSLRKLTNIKSASTVADYCQYLENSYLCFFVNRYDHSLKTQLLSPKKVYFIDHVITRNIGFKTSSDYGRTIENIVFLELKRRRMEVYYHRRNKECDFIIRQNNQIIQAIQVCKELNNAATKRREIAGLTETLQLYSLTTGLIITENEEFTEQVECNACIFTIQALPIWKWLTITSAGTI